MANMAQIGHFGPIWPYRPFWAQEGPGGVPGRVPVLKPVQMGVCGHIWPQEAHLAQKGPFGPFGPYWPPKGGTLPLEAQNTPFGTPF